MLLYKNHYKAWLFIIFSFGFTSYASAQNDSTIAEKADTIKSTKQKYHRGDAFVVYGGINWNDLKGTSSLYESVSGPGWHLGIMYKKESFFYWQVGARLNHARFSLTEYNSTDTTHDAFSVTDLDIPITAGINLLPITKRVLNVHVFVSAVPVFQLNVGDNSLGITKDQTNSFKFYGQAGAGVDILFLVLEGGINLGFTDFLKDAESKPNQFFVSLGFRF